MIVRLTTVLFFASILLTTQVQADDKAEEKARAAQRAKFSEFKELGYGHAGKRRYKKALESFEKAISYETGPDPDMLFDMGSIAFGLKECPKAILFFQGFLKTLPDKDGAKDAQEKIATCSRSVKMGTLDIVATPKGAEIRVNHVYLGSSPVNGVSLPEGTYSVKSTMEDYHPYSGSTNVEPDLSTRHRFSLEKKIYKGNLTVNVNPKDGAVVFLNRVKLGAAPVTRKGLTTRRYLVHVEKEGWDRWVRYVTVEKNSTITVDVRLEKTNTDVPIPPLPKN